MIRCLDCGLLIRSGSRCAAHQHKYTGAWKRTRAMVLERDHHHCVICGRPCPHPRHHHVDHIRHDIPNRDSLANLRTVCAAFNVGGQRSCG